MLYSHCSVSQWVQHILVAKQKGNFDRHEKQDFAFCQSHGSLKGVTCHLTIIKYFTFVFYTVENNRLFQLTKIIFVAC